MMILLGTLLLAAAAAPQEGIPKTGEPFPVLAYPQLGAEGLQPRQGGAQAEVQTEAETQVARGIPEDVETVTIGELPIIAIRRREHGGDIRAPRDGYPGDLGIAGRPAEDDLDRRIEAQSLFDEASYSGRILEKQRQLVGMIVERIDAIADEVRRGLVPSDQQQHDELNGFRIAQGVALAGIDEQTDQVILR